MYVDWLFLLEEGEMAGRWDWCDWWGGVIGVIGVIGEVV